MTCSGVIVMAKWKILSVTIGPSVLTFAMSLRRKCERPWRRWAPEAPVIPRPAERAEDRTTANCDTQIKVGLDIAQACEFDGVALERLRGPSNDTRFDYAASFGL